MSRRTFPRVAAAVLLAAAATAAPPPALGQSPNPWRSAGPETAPPPRPKGGPVEVDLRLNWTYTEPAPAAQFIPAPAPAAAQLLPATAPAPRAAAKPSCCESGPCPSCPYCGAAQPAPAPPAVMAYPPPRPVERVQIERVIVNGGPAPALPYPAQPVIVTGSVMPTPVVPPVAAPPVFAQVGPPAPPLPPQPVAAATLMTRSVQPVGTWYREQPGCVVAVTFRGEECKATVTLNDGSSTATITLTADCAVARDGTVHGVVTGADVEMAAGKGADKDGPAAEWAELAMELQTLVDQPFAFRCRPADGGLMISSLRVGGTDDLKELCLAVGGRYKPAANGSVPAPKPGSWKKCEGGRCDALPLPPDVLLPPGVFVPPGFPVPFPPGVFPVQGPPAAYGAPVMPPAAYLQHPPQFFPPDAMIPPLGCPGGTCPAPGAPRPVVGITMAGGPPRCQPSATTGPDGLTRIGVDFSSTAPQPVCQPPMVMPPPLPCPAQGCPATGAVAGGLTIAWAGGAASTAAPAKLSLGDVIDLAKAGCGDDVIISQIQKTGSTYSLHTQDIIKLKKGGVSDRVILEMQGATPPASAPAGYAPTPPTVLERVNGGISN